MSDKKSVRLNKLVKEFNVSIDRIFAFLETKEIKELKPNSKVSHDVYMDLLGEFDSEKKAKLSAELLAKEKELAKAEEIIKQQEVDEKNKQISEDKARIKAEKDAEVSKKIKVIEENPSSKDIPVIVEEKEKKRYKNYCLYLSIHAQLKNRIVQPLQR